MDQIRRAAGAAPGDIVVREGFWGDVQRRVPHPLEHRLLDEPLLAREEVARLGGELGPDGISAERAVKPLIAAPGDARAMTDAESISRELLDLADNDSWFTLLHVERVPRYRDLVDRLLDQLASSCGRSPRELRRRNGFVFASSPGSVTSAHFDIEHSVLLQIAGERTLGFGRFRDDEHRQAEVEKYWTGSFGRLDAMPETVQEVALRPGTGCYIPPWTPHWLVNGQSPSLSLTVTFFERGNEDESLVQVVNARLDRVGLPTRRFGERPRVDATKAGLMRGVRTVRTWAGRPEGTSGSH